MNSYSGFIIGLVMIGLFTFSIISFAINFALDNNSSVNIANDSEITTLNTQIKGNLSSFRGSSEQSYKSIVNSSIGSAGQTIPTAGAFTISPPNPISIIKNILLVGYTKIFGSNDGFAVILTGFISIIVFLAFLSLWKAWAGRTPD